MIARDLAAKVDLASFDINEYIYNHSFNYYS